jgi:hypothetical protein
MPATRRIPRGPSVPFDPRRNTSAVHAVSPLAGREAIAACERFARENPEHAAWLAAGAPPIHSDAEHVRWFGESYTSTAPRRRRSSR